VLAICGREHPCPSEWFDRQGNLLDYVDRFFDEVLEERWIAELTNKWLRRGTNRSGD
jgi:hypothetical protein